MLLLSVASLLLSCCFFCGVVAVVVLLFLWRCCCCRVAFSVVSLLLSCCFLCDSLCQSLAPFPPTHFLNNRCLTPESMKLTTVFIQGTYPSYQINFYEITNCIFALCCVVSVIVVRLDVSKSIHRQPLPTYVSLSNVACHRLTVTIKRVMWLNTFSSFSDTYDQLHMHAYRQAPKCPRNLFYTIILQSTIQCYCQVPTELH